MGGTKLLQHWAICKCAFPEAYCWKSGWEVICARGGVTFRIHHTWPANPGNWIAMEYMEAGQVEKTNCASLTLWLQGMKQMLVSCIFPYFSHIQKARIPWLPHICQEPSKIIKHPLARFFLLDQIGVSAPCRPSLLEWSGAQQCAQNLSWQGRSWWGADHHTQPQKKHIKTY